MRCTQKRLRRAFRLSAPRGGALGPSRGTVGARADGDGAETWQALGALRAPGAAGSERAGAVVAGKRTGTPRTGLQKSWPSTSTSSSVGWMGGSAVGWLGGRPGVGRTLRDWADDGGEKNEEIDWRARRGLFAKRIEGWRAVFSKIDPPLLLAIGWGSSGLD